jgi:hypothetical protein
MKTYAKRTKFTPVLGKVTAALIAVFLAGVSAGGAAQAGDQSPPPASPNSAVAWVQKDSQGLWVYYLSSTGTASTGQQLTPAAPPPGAPPAPHCIWTGYVWIC